MQVTTSKGNQTVHICKTHEDDASPKKVRELAEKRNAMLEDFERQAHELGFKLVPVGGGIITATSPEQPSTPTVDESQVGETIKSVPVIKIPKKIAPLAPRQIAAPSIAGNTDLGKHNSYDTTKAVTRRDGTEINAPGVLEADEQVVEGRAGMPISIPKKVVSEAGTTEIMIIKGGEKKIQERMKAMTQANNKESLDRAINSGYVTHECTLCKGTGITRINNQTCVKCGGAGNT